MTKESLTKKVLRNGGLGVAEHAGKAASIPGGVIAAGSEGNIAEKVSEGYQKIATSIPDAFSKAKYFTEAAYDFTNSTASEFTNKYGGEVFNALQEGFGNFGEYVENFADQPIESVAAGAIAGASMYAMGRLAKFARQKGKGSWLDNLERKAGDKIWNEKE